MKWMFIERPKSSNTVLDTTDFTHAVLTAMYGKRVIHSVAMPDAVVLFFEVEE